MSTVVDTAVRSILGLSIVFAMLALVWLAHGTSATATPTAGAHTGHSAFDERAPAPTASTLGSLHSARADRGVVVRTAIPSERLEQLERLSSRSTPVATSEPAFEGPGKKDLL